MENRRFLVVAKKPTIERRVIHESSDSMDSGPDDDVSGDFVGSFSSSVDQLDSQQSGNESLDEAEGESFEEAEEESFEIEDNIRVERYVQQETFTLNSLSGRSKNDLDHEYEETHKRYQLAQYATLEEVKRFLTQVLEIEPDIRYVPCGQESIMNTDLSHLVFEVPYGFNEDSDICELVQHCFALQPEGFVHQAVCDELDKVDAEVKRQTEEGEKEDMTRLLKKQAELNAQLNALLSDDFIRFVNPCYISPVNAAVAANSAEEGNKVKEDQGKGKEEEQAEEDAVVSLQGNGTLFGAPSTRAKPGRDDSFKLTPEELAAIREHEEQERSIQHKM